MKNLFFTALIIILVGLGAYFVFWNSSRTTETIQDQNRATDTDQQKDTEEEKMTVEDKGKTTIGTSVNGQDIVAYHYGTGDQEILFVGGIHGGYSWNTALVAGEAMNYFEANPTQIPENLKVTIIPVLNPDGLVDAVGTSTVSFTKAEVSPSSTVQAAARFNANTVDLNRNFDCDWQSDATWRNTTVSGGNTVFSEPESRAIRNYVLTSKPTAVVAWYSAAGGVFASSCHAGILQETLAITNVFAKASGYPAYENFDFYKITGDMVNWLAKEKIPAISVLLTTHESTEWSKNKAGITALLEYYAK